MKDAVGIWVLTPDQELGAAARHAMDGSVPPDVSAVILSSTGDVLGVQLAGAGPQLERGSRVYLERHGGFEVVGEEVWPAAVPGGVPRVLLALRAWPGRG